MELIKLNDKEKKLQAALPALNDEQVGAIAAFIRGVDYYRFLGEDGFCCASDAVDDMPDLSADCLLNAYGIKNDLVIRDRDHDDYIDEDDEDEEDE